jgi:hypothetical protein
MADTTALLTLAEAEQHDFVALTRALTDDQWAAPSLCTPAPQAQDCAQGGRSIADISNAFA